MKSILYLFRRFKVASTLNVLGVALALAGCYLLLTQIHFILSYNHGIKDNENIYRVEFRNFMGEEGWEFVLNKPVIEALDNIPQVESYACLLPVNDEDSFSDLGSQSFDKNGTTIKGVVTEVNDSMLVSIGAECVDGRLYMHHNEDGVIIPASFALEYFGDVMVAGKQLRLSAGGRLNVIGVYKDFPDNSAFQNRLFRVIRDSDHKVGLYQEWNYVTYLHFKPGISSDEVNTLVRGAFLKKARELSAADGISAAEAQKELKDIEIKCIPLADTYLKGHCSNVDRGNKTVLYIIELALFLLFVISVINFTNYSMAQTPMRLRGINTRKVMGESTSSIRCHLLAEGALVGAIASVFALLIDYVISLYGSVGIYVLGSVSLAAHWCIALIVIFIGIVIGILSTIYSAYYVTSFQPAMVLKGGIGLSPQGKSVRKILIGFQFVIAFIMIIFVSVVYSQSFYIINSDYGYDKDNLLYGNIIRVPEKKQDALVQDLKGLNGVVDVAFSSIPLSTLDGTMTCMGGNASTTYNFRLILVSSNFLRTCGIPVIEGRDFNESDYWSKSNICIVNKAMKNLDKHVMEDEEFKVVGVCDNLRFFSTRVYNAGTPVAFTSSGDMSGYTPRSIMYVRLAPHTNKKHLRKQVSDIVKRFTDDHVAPEMKFLKECFHQIYPEEQRFMTQIRISTLLIFIITIIGVFCLTMFETEYRRKEIAIRKVMGSSVGEVIALFTRRYTLPLIISFVVAAPVAYYLGEQWLLNFAEHTPIYWWIFPLAFVLVSLVVLLTVVVQCWRVATMNPVDSIKSE